MLQILLLFSGAALLAAATVVSQNQPATQTQPLSGVSETVFQTRAGKVKVYLPDDLAAGDTISGTVIAEPASAKDPKQEQKNAGELSGYVLELGANRSNTRDKQFHWILPEKISAATIDLLLTDGRGRTLGRQPVSISPSAPSSARNFQIPNLTQAGRPVQIPGSFDGNSANTSAKLGGADLPVLAESPRKAIFQNPQTSSGVLPVAINENGVSTNGTTRNIQIELRAEKLDLLRGEQTELKVTVTGLAGLAEKLPIRLTNESPEVVTLTGGNVQTLETSGNSTNDKEQFSRTLTGIKPGKYSVTTEVPKFEPIADVKVQVGQPSTQPPTTTQPPSTQPSPTPPRPTPSSSPATLTVPPKPSSTPSPTPSPASGTTGPTGAGVTPAPASGAPQPLPTGPEQTIPDAAVPAVPLTAVPNPTPEKKANPCCDQIRKKNDPGFGTRLIWRQGNNSFELMGRFLFLEVNGVRAQWKFDRNLEEVFCYMDKYEIESEVKQVSETNLKNGKTTEKQETTSLLFAGPDPDNKSTRQYKFFQFMASKLNDKDAKEYAVSLTVNEKECDWSLALFGNEELAELTSPPPHQPSEIFNALKADHDLQVAGQRPYSSASWWDVKFRELSEIVHWCSWLKTHPDEDKMEEVRRKAFGGWCINMRRALEDLKANGKNLSAADRKAIDDMSKLVNQDVFRCDDAAPTLRAFVALWGRFTNGGASF